MIIDSEEVYNSHFPSDRSYFIVPFGIDNRLHSKENKLIALVAIDIESEQAFTVGLEHPDAIYQRDSISEMLNNQSIVYNKHILNYNNYNIETTPDADVVSYLTTNTIPEQSEYPLIGYYRRMYSNCLMINKVIPLHKLEEIAFEIFNKYYYSLNESIEGIEYYNKAQQVFYNIEANGLKINTQLFAAFYGRVFAQIEDYCYGKYNLFTSTGRPSNTFNGVNLAALNKDDGSRGCFVSRYEDGILLEIDFESYHPRIICDIIDYEIDGNMYEHLCGLYYPNEPITPELIKQSKENTFRQIYGGVDKAYLGIDFFRKINDFTRSLYSFYKKNKYIELPSGRKLRIGDDTDINSHKIFNYFIQALETENNVDYLTQLIDKFKNTSILPVLYVYDSILFDLKKAEMDECITAISSIIPTEKYPIKVKIGDTYNDMNVLV